MATLHANSANQAMERIINFSGDRRAQLLVDLSLNIKGVERAAAADARTARAGAAVVESLLNTAA